MTAKTGKDVTEDAETTEVAEAAVEESEAPRAESRPARKKVRRVRVIEVIDDGEDDDDLSDVLEALDQEEPDPPAPGKGGPAKRVSAEAASAKAAPEPGPAEAEAETEEAAGEIQETAEEEAEAEAAEPKPAKAKPKPAKAKPKPRRVKAASAPVPLRDGSLILKVVAVVLVAGLATSTLLLWKSWRTLAQKEDARREVTKMVTDYGNVVLSYDRTDLQGSVARAQSYLTGDALTKSKQTNVAQLQKSMDEGEFTLVSKTSQVYVASADGRFASAVLVFDISVKSPTGTQDVTRNYLSLSLVRQDGTWKISQQKPAGRESDDNAGAVPDLNGQQTPKTPEKSAKPKD
ncbi:hypothetical protein SAMN04489712_102376 [Thermomonospora echinospora]|uniref:Mce-associated membrane protein n=1 Tax=Thermomonospora echinospora TaxID=1992 RepID=A0A1H5VMX4_9ACTN|nr:hypothetical protein [Thermomonospora echinospora]SEF88366.1 hypothetical protein SAMN04489712_102376 [Thermomonospora echinospora]